MVVKVHHFFGHPLHSLGFSALLKLWWCLINFAPWNKLIKNLLNFNFLQNYIARTAHTKEKRNGPVKRRIHCAKREVFFAEDCRATTMTTTKNDNFAWHSSAPYSFQTCWICLFSVENLLWPRWRTYDFVLCCRFSRLAALSFAQLLVCLLIQFNYSLFFMLKVM